MEKRLNSPSGQNFSTTGFNSIKQGSSQNAGTNIKKTIDILRQRLSISPNRAMETIQRINVNQTLANSQSWIYKEGKEKNIKFEKERGSVTSNPQTVDNFQLSGGVGTILRTERSYKRYGVGATPPKSKDSSRNNSQTKKLSNPLGSKKNFPTTKVAGKLDSSSISGDGSRVIDKSSAASTKKISHNIYMPKQSKKGANPEEMVRKINIDLSRGGSQNRSSTPNTRDSVKTRLLGGLIEDKSRGESSLNLSSGGLNKQLAAGKTLISRLKAEGMVQTGDKRSSQLGGRR